MAKKKKTMMYLRTMEFVALRLIFFALRGKLVIRKANCGFGDGYGLVVSSM